MARTISEIYNSMIVEKETFSTLNTLLPTGQANPMQSLLTDLTNTSKVAVWRLIFFVVSVSIWIHESLFDTFKTEVNTIIESAIPSTLSWWISTVKAFQYGDTLIWNGYKYVYPIINTDNQIVTQCAISITQGIFYIKVATTSGGVVVPLSAGQKTSLSSYINKVMPAGTSYFLISQNSDLLKLAYNVYYDALKLNSDGSLPTNITSFPVRDAIMAYINYLDTYDFNGIFYIAKLTDAIQSVDGVINVVANTVEAKSGSLPYADLLKVSDQSYISIAGYLDIDPSYPLSSVITYIAQ